MAKREYTYTWFVEPLNSHSKKVISEEINDDYLHRHLQCEDGKIHNLWECPNWNMLKFLWENRQNLKIKFRIYTQQDKYGKIKLWRFFEEH